jgi:TRAP-type C4-dicarboxylate transport system substrate-binding protein
VAPSVGHRVPTGKSGAGTTLDIRLVVVGRSGTAPAAIAARFARGVAELSKGSMHVAVDLVPSGQSTASSRGAQTVAIRSVTTGADEMGLIPTGSFRTVGVTTLDALQAPFLITSSSLAARATRGPIAARLESGLARLGLSGLALVPDGLERPFGFLKPLVAPADFAGVTIRAAYAPSTYALLRQLRARPVDVDAADTDTAVYSGFAKDPLSTSSASDRFPQDSYTAAGIVLFPHVEAIVASRTALDSLTASQRSILRRAALAARTGTIAAGETAEAAAFCLAGGTVVDASPSALPALRAATAPLLEALSRNERTRQILAAIVRLGSGGGDPVRRCTGTHRVSQFGNGEHYPRAVRDELLPPNGSYRRAFTASQLRAAGLPPSEVDANEGVTTLTLSGSRHERLFFTLSWLGPSRRPACRGRVALVNRHIALEWNPETPCIGPVSFSSRVEPDGDVVIVAVEPSTRPRWLRRLYPGLWKRVECTPSFVGPAETSSSSGSNGAC